MACSMTSPRERRSWPSNAAGVQGAVKGYFDRYSGLGKRGCSQVNQISSRSGSLSPHGQSPAPTPPRLARWSGLVRRRPYDARGCRCLPSAPLPLPFSLQPGPPLHTRCRVRGRCTRIGSKEVDRVPARIGATLHTVAGRQRRGLRTRPGWRSYRPACSRRHSIRSPRFQPEPPGWPRRNRTRSRPTGGSRDAPSHEAGCRRAAPWSSICQALRNRASVGPRRSQRSGRTR